MAFQKIENVKITGIAACVPDNSLDNMDLALLGDLSDRAKFVETTGIAKRYTVADKNICTSDLCFEAAEKLIKELDWNKEEIDCLIFVSQTPDYILEYYSDLDNMDFKGKHQIQREAIQNKKEKDREMDFFPM